jgi:hypothetical protein
MTWFVSPEDLRGGMRIGQRMERIYHIVNKLDILLGG